MSEQKITRWTNSRFETVAQPEWWQSEIGRIESDPSIPDDGYGMRDIQDVSVWRLESDRGWIATFSNAMLVLYVHAQTDADYLDLLTTRVPAFISLGEDRPIASSLSDIRNAIFSWARHGQGEHIDRDTGESNIDRRRDREQRLRDRAAAQGGT
jgi:hypothetical protein